VIFNRVFDRNAISYYLVKKLQLCSQDGANVFALEIRSTSTFGALNLFY